MTVAATIGLMLASGCSIVSTKGPGNWTPESKRAPVCDTSNGLPRAVDIVLAGVSLVSAVGVTFDQEDIHWDKASRGAAAAGLVLVAGAAAYSAIVGRGRVIECRAAHADHKAEVWRPTPRADERSSPPLALGDDPRTLPPEHMPKPAAEPQSRVRVENGVTVILVDHPFYCFEVKDTGVRMCASEIERCRLVAHSMKSVATCESTPGAACFRVRDTVSGRTIGWCFATMDWCQKGKEFFSDPDTTVLDEKCIVMRRGQ